MNKKNIKPDFSTRNNEFIGIYQEVKENIHIFPLSLYINVSLRTEPRVLKKCISNLIF